MESTVQRPIIDSERVNLVFGGYDDFTKALTWPATILTEVEKMGLKGIVSVSMDNSDEHPIMSFAGPKKVIDVLLDGLSDEGVNYRIDVTKSDEPDIVKRQK